MTMSLINFEKMPIYLPWLLYLIMFPVLSRVPEIILLLSDCQDFCQDDTLKLSCGMLF